MEYFAATNKKPSSKRPVGANTFAPPPRAPHPDHLPQKLRAQPRSDAHLRSAAAAGRVDELRSLIAVRGDVNATSGTGATACFLAAARGQHASLATLLLLPDQKDEAQFRKRTWPAKGRYAAITVALVAVALAYSLAVNLLSMFESTMCLRFAGGDGCEEAPVTTAAAPH